MNITILGAGNMEGALTRQLTLSVHCVRVISREPRKSRELASRYRGGVAASPLNIYFGYDAGHGTAIAPTWISRAESVL